MDLLYKGRLEGWDIALAYTVATEASGEAVRRHGCDPVAAHVLGRAIGTALLAAAPLGEGARLNVRWTYGGLLRTVLVDAGPDGAVRGFITPSSLQDAADADALYGAQGQLQVVRSRGGAVLASGTAEARMQDVASDLALFQCVSDQVETAAVVLIALDAREGRPVRVCRGLQLQALPGCDLERFQRVRARLEGPRARDLLGRIEESDSVLDNLAKLLAVDEAPPRLAYEAMPPPQFRCTCTREKMGGVLRAIPIPERMEIARKKEDVAVSCRFCNTRYTLTLDECIAAWNEGLRRGAPGQAT